MHRTLLSLTGWESIWCATEAVWFILAPQFHTTVLSLTVEAESNKILNKRIRIKVSPWLPPAPAPAGNSWEQQHSSTGATLFSSLLKLNQMHHIYTNNLLFLLCFSLALNDFQCIYILLLPSLFFVLFFSLSACLPFYSNAASHWADGQLIN